MARTCLLSARSLGKSARLREGETRAAVSRCSAERRRTPPYLSAEARSSERYLEAILRQVISSKRTKTRGESCVLVFQIRSSPPVIAGADAITTRYFNDCELLRTKDNMNAVVQCGGKGTRLQPLISILPKTSDADRSAARPRARAQMGSGAMASEKFTSRPTSFAAFAAMGTSGTCGSTARRSWSRSERSGRRHRCANTSMSHSWEAGRCRM